MRVFITGATGFIGGHILDAVLDAGHEATCLARGAGRARLTARPEACEGRLRTVDGEFTRPEGWLASVAGHEGVVNAVGVIREGRGAGSSFEAIHRDAPVALFTAAARAGARKIVQVSACGADEGAATRYHLTKRDADRALASMGVPWVVLRPSIVYGPGDHSMAWFARLAALPVVPVPGSACGWRGSGRGFPSPGSGAALLEPVHVPDVARAALLSLERADLSGFAADLGGGEPLRFDALIDRIAAALGLAVPRRKAYIPWPLMRLAAGAGDLLGGRGPITGEELSMLRRGNVTRGRAFEERFGFAPTPLDVGLAQRFAARGTLFPGATDRGSNAPED